MASTDKQIRCESRLTQLYAEPIDLGHERLDAGWKADGIGDHVAKPIARWGQPCVVKVQIDVSSPH